MAYWIKANTKVVEFIGMTTDRNQLKDGNWLLFQNDLLKLNMGSLVHIFEICEAIGALVLNHDQAKQEQDGTLIRTLPTATDARFVIASPTTAEKSPTIDETAEGDKVTASDAENATDGAESPEITGDGDTDDEADADGGEDPDPTQPETEEETINE